MGPNGMNDGGAEYAFIPLSSLFVLGGSALEEIVCCGLQVGSSRERFRTAMCEYLAYLLDQSAPTWAAESRLGSFKRS